MNYCDKDVPYTRIMSWRHIGYQDGEAWPITWNIRRMRVNPTTQSRRLATWNCTGNMRRYCVTSRPMYTAGGRLGMYQYLNMDQAIGAGHDAC
jgi:UDP-galactopyranose mutase